MCISSSNEIDGLSDWLIQPITAPLKSLRRYDLKNVSNMFTILKIVMHVETITKAFQKHYKNTNRIICLECFEN